MSAVVIVVEERLLRTRRYLAAMQLLPPLQIAKSLALSEEILHKHETA